MLVCTFAHVAQACVCNTKLLRPHAFLVPCTRCTNGRVQVYEQTLHTVSVQGFLVEVVTNKSDVSVPVSGRFRMDERGVLNVFPAPKGRGFPPPEGDVPP